MSHHVDEPRTAGAGTAGPRPAPCRPPTALRERLGPPRPAAARADLHDHRDPAAVRGDAGHLVHELERLLPRRARASPASTTTGRCSPTSTSALGDLHDDRAHRRSWCWSAWSSAWLIALLLDRKFLGRGVVRTMMIAPFLIVPVAAALLWKHALYNPEYGLINGMLTRSGTCSASNPPQPDWITELPRCSRSRSSLIWQWTPFMMLILLAGLQSRPLDVIEAARIDGAGAVADLPLHDAPAPAPVPGARRLLGLDLHRADLRRGLHHHLRRPGHGQPAVHDLPDLLPAPTTTAWPRPRASSSSSARSSSRPSPCAPCRQPVPRRKR